MHTIAPYAGWREIYNTQEDSYSPFYGVEYDEFVFTNKIYNYYIHPQWDAFGSETLYAKILYTNYDKGYTIIELLGEWNDAIENDIMLFRQEVIDPLIEQGIYKYILLCDNVLNFHGSDDAYYEDWWDEIKEHDGWVCCINTLLHVKDEMLQTRLQFYINFDEKLNDIHWRPMLPQNLFMLIEMQLNRFIKKIKD